MPKSSIKISDSFANLSPSQKVHFHKYPRRMYHSFLISNLNVPILPRAALYFATSLCRRTKAAGARLQRHGAVSTDEAGTGRARACATRSHSIASCQAPRLLALTSDKYLFSGLFFIFIKFIHLSFPCFSVNCQGAYSISSLVKLSGENPFIFHDESANISHDVMKICEIGENFKISRVNYSLWKLKWKGKEHFQQFSSRKTSGQ